MSLFESLVRNALESEVSRRPGTTYAAVAESMITSGRIADISRAASDIMTHAQHVREHDEAARLGYKYNGSDVPERGPLSSLGEALAHSNRRLRAMLDGVRELARRAREDDSELVRMVDLNELLRKDEVLQDEVLQEAPRAKPALERVTGDV